MILLLGGTGYIGQAFALAQEANRYLDCRAPWKNLKVNREDAATSLWTAIAVINCLKVALAPFLPFTSQRVHQFLGCAGSVESEQWDFDRILAGVKPGQTLQRPENLYIKLEPQVAEEESQRLGIKV